MMPKIHPKEINLKKEIIFIIQTEVKEALPWKGEVYKWEFLA